jgi:iron complex transport system substrate-binding protein
MRKGKWIVESVKKIGGVHEMGMKKILSIVLVTVLLASAVPMAVTPAAAIGPYEKKIPGDADENNELTKDELVNAILPYMLDEGDFFTLDDVGDASWVYAYWDGKQKTVVDDDKHETILYRPVERVVVAYAHPYTLLRAIEATDRIVAGRNYRLDLYPDLIDMPIIAMGGWNIDFEAVISYHPDLVFIRPHSSRVETNQYKKIKEMNPSIAVVSLYCYRSWNATDYLEDARQLGCLLDKEEEAEEFIDYFEGFMDTIEEKVSDIPEKDKKRVYYEGGGGMATMPQRYRTGGSGSSKGGTIVLAGGKNIFSDIKGSAVGAEDVIRLDPEIIIKSAHGGGYDIDDISGLRNARDEVMNRVELQNVTAVKTGRVYVISKTIDCCGASGGRYFLASVYIAKSIYPNIDINPAAIHQDFITRFQGMDFDAHKHGVFAYHPEQFPEGR